MRQLGLGEAAFLAALTRGPNFYHPTLHPDRLQDRREYVLDRMKEDGYIQPPAFQPAVDAKPTLVDFESPRSRAAYYFLDEIQRDAKRVKNIASLTASSYVIRSTIHRELQRSAETALQNGLADYEMAAGRTGEFKPEGSIADDIYKYKSTWQETLPKVRPKLFDVQWPLAVVLPAGNQPNNRNSIAGPRGARVGLVDGRDLQVTATSNAIISRLKPYDLVHVKLNENPKGDTASIRTRPTVQGAIVVLEAKTGKVLAMSGGFSYAMSQLNRTTRSARQPGSTLKPFIYLSALQFGFQPNTLIPDMPLTFPPLYKGGKPWTPHNYDGGSRGLVTMRTAVEQSLNLPTVRMMKQLGDTAADGLDYIRNIVQEVGIYNEPIRFYPFVLGAQPARLIDMAVAYATIANLGLKPTATLIDSIDENGTEIYHRPRFDLRKIEKADQVAFYQIRRILEGTLERGTAVHMKDLAGSVAGKTGTSNNESDAWFVGFTNDLVVATWVGYDSARVRGSHNGTLGGGFTGGRVALPIAEKVIRDSFKVYKPVEPLQGPPPEIQDKIVTYPIDQGTGRFNAGNFKETFRIMTGKPGTPLNTQASALESGEENLPMASDPVGDEDAAVQAETESVPQQGQAQNYYGGNQGYYQPGADDMYDYWRTRSQPRRVDPFISNPGYIRR